MGDVLQLSYDDTARFLRNSLVVPGRIELAQAPRDAACVRAPRWFASLSTEAAPLLTLASPFVMHQLGK